jgi:hypothetical protein
MALLTGLLLAAATPSTDIPGSKGPYVHAVMVDGAGTIRVLPPDNDAWGEPHDALSPSESALATQVATAIVKGPHPSPLLASEHLTDLPGFYISETYPDGLQRRSTAHGSADALPTVSMNCSLAAPVSLGHDKGFAYAFVQVDCATDSFVWDRFKLGMTMKDGHVTAAAVSNGQDANLFRAQPPANPNAAK